MIFFPVEEMWRKWVSIHLVTYLIKMINGFPFSRLYIFGYSEQTLKGKQNLSERKKERKKSKKEEGFLKYRGSLTSDEMIQYIQQEAV